MGLYLHRWSYKCLDMLSSLQTEYFGSNYNLLEFYLYRDTPTAEFYVDAVHIGKRVTTFDENGTQARSSFATVKKIRPYGYGDVWAVETWNTNTLTV